MSRELGPRQGDFNLIFDTLTYRLIFDWLTYRGRHDLCPFPVNWSWRYGPWLQAIRRASKQKSFLAPEASATWKAL